MKLDILKNLVINYFRDGKNVFYFVGFPIFHLTFSLWKITGIVFQTVNKCLQVDFEALPTVLTQLSIGLQISSTPLQWAAHAQSSTPAQWYFKEEEGRFSW